MANKIDIQGTEYYVSCGNVFADLGLPNPEERQLKAYLAMTLTEAIQDKRLTEKQAAQTLGLSQPEFSELQEGALTLFSVNQLVQYLNCLGYDVQLSATVRERAPEAEQPRPQETREAVAA